MSGIGAAVVATRQPGPPLEIVPGVEITASFRGRELHLLGYWIDTRNGALNDALARLRSSRANRLVEMAERFCRFGVRLDEADIASLRELSSPGRRHLAALLVRTGRVRSISEAFVRYLSDDGPVAVPKEFLPIESALSLVREAGGMSSWAHPPESVSLRELDDLREMGLDAIEAIYPTFGTSRRRNLRELAKAARLGVTGGSDSHGAKPLNRDVGATTLAWSDYLELRRRAPGAATIQDSTISKPAIS
jgi:hypothetical protein